MFKSLISRVILLNILLLSIGVATFSLVHIQRDHRDMQSSAEESADLLLTTIENAIFNAMRVGNSDDVQATLENVGRGSRIVHVRIFEPDGTIIKSAQPEEIGTRVNPKELALYQNKGSEAIFDVNGQEVLGMVRPIRSQQACYRCHAQKQDEIIGLLSLNFSLSPSTERLKESTEFFAATTGVILVLLSLGSAVILIRFVKRPIFELQSKMEQVENGDLDVRMTPAGDDEIGRASRSFNSMVENLLQARKQLESYHFQQMERADRLASLGEMATGVAHEVKNPLAGISSAISVMADDFSEDDPRRDIFQQILEQLRRLDKTATDLLVFGRPGKPEFSYVDLNDLVKKTLFFVSQHPEARNIHRRKDLSRDLPPVWADAKQIQQVVLNISINAIQAMQAGGSLLLSTALVERHGHSVVQLKISDTGKGIPQEELEKIFVPFYTTKTQGTGLGLPICKQLLEQHRGTIGVESRLGEGTTFTIELPALAGQDLGLEGAESA